MPTSPALVGLLRGVLEAAVLSALAVLATWLTTADLGELAPYAPAAWLLLRAVEGVLDAKIDPTKQRGTLGGKPWTGDGGFFRLLLALYVVVIIASALAIIGSSAVAFVIAIVALAGSVVLLHHDSRIPKT